MGECERRQRFGTYLAGLRRATGRSQRQLADVLCALSGTQSVTRNEISRWERGGRVLEASWMPFVSRALSVPLADLEQAVAYARGDHQARLPGALLTLAELLPEGDPLERLVQPDGRRIGMADAEVLAGRAHRLRLSDDVLAGGDLVGPAFRELRRGISVYRSGSFTEATGQALLVALGELGQIVGWIASDAGRLDDAEQVYRIGLSAARQAGDTVLAGHLGSSLAYQWSNNGREAEAVDLAEAAVHEAGEAQAPAARAMFMDRMAWAHTRAGHAQAAMRALGQAHETLESGTGPQAPLWAYWVSPDELDVMDARVYTELRRPLRAVPVLTDVLGRYDATRARELALYRSWLAIALADANEPEQAAAEAQRVIDLSGDLASDRTAVRIRVVLQRLKAYTAVPEVRAILDGHAHLLLA